MSKKECALEATVERLTSELAAAQAENARLREAAAELYAALNSCRDWAREYDFMSAPLYKRMVDVLTKHKALERAR